MQPKISSFFKQPAPPEVPDDFGDDPLALWEKAKNVIVRRYERRAPKSNGNIALCGGGSVSEEEGTLLMPEPSMPGPTVNKNKKRSYAQTHLDLGQSDFHLRTCSACGINYAPGDESDEKTHMVFHRNYTHGVPFKGWINERVIHLPSVKAGRIVSVLHSDPPAHRNKVQEVVNLMERELGCEWIYNEQCKVYLFIFCQRIAGCLVAEPIKEAFRVISDTETRKDEAEEGPAVNEERARTKSAGLRFGNVTFQREVSRRLPSVVAKEEDLTGATYCEEEAVPAVCGVRAVWVSPSHRRKRIATHLLDSLRRSFCTGTVLDHSQLAFSLPTSAGKALLLSYMGGRPKLLYRPDISNFS